MARIDRLRIFAEVVQTRKFTIRLERGRGRHVQVHAGQMPFIEQNRKLQTLLIELLSSLGGRVKVDTEPPQTKHNW
jgi:hypothetical protein